MDHKAAFEELMVRVRQFPKCHWGHAKRKLFLLYEAMEKDPKVIDSDETSAFLQAMWKRHLDPRPYPTLEQP